MPGRDLIDFEEFKHTLEQKMFGKTDEILNLKKLKVVATSEDLTEEKREFIMTKFFKSRATSKK